MALEVRDDGFGCLDSWIGFLGWGSRVDNRRSGDGVVRLGVRTKKQSCALSPVSIMPPELIKKGI